MCIVHDALPGKYIISMFEYMNKKSAVVKRVCTHKYVELIIAYINIAIVMGLFLWGYSCKYELKIQISAPILIELPFVIRSTVNRDVFWEPDTSDIF